MKKSKKRCLQNHLPVSFILTCTVCLLPGYGNINAQTPKDSLAHDLQIQKVVVEKRQDNDKLKNVPKYYLAFDYDYADTITVFVDNKKIYDGRLKYSLPDSDVASFPYNRVLIRISKNYVVSKCSGCRIIFWESRKVANFCLFKKIQYYHLGVIKNKPVWYLNLLNKYPWPD